MTSLPLNSVVAVATYTSDSTLFVKGYAVPGGNGNVSAVHVSIDGGDSWVPTTITYQEGKWSWTLWEVELKDVPSNGLVYSRATDVKGNVQKRESAWNMRGVAYDAWGRKIWTGPLPC